MDAFDRLVSGLSRAELDECALDLLDILGGAAPEKGAADALWEEVAHSAASPGDRAAETDADNQGAKLTADIKAAAKKISEMLFGGGTPYGPRETAGESPARAQAAPGAAADAAGRAAAADYTSAAAGLARNAHARYENAVGIRGLEMSRVSDYFRRDSRRYDSGFERY